MLSTVDTPEVRYARVGEINIAYQVSGDGPIDVIMVPGFISHRDLEWEHPVNRAGWERIGRFARLIQFDKRGTGLSDPIATVPTLEDRCADALAVLDAVGSERAHVWGASEGAATAILLAATHPDRVESLILFGGAARAARADDYPIGNVAQDMVTAGVEWIMPFWGQGASIETFAPSAVDMPGARELYAKMERMGAPPGTVPKLFAAYLEVDVRSILSAVQVPTLIMHRVGDRVVNVRHGRYLAEHIPGATYVELPGADHNYFLPQDGFLDHVEEFLTGAIARTVSERVLATVMFTDIVASTQQAAAAGDASWRSTVASHDAVVREQLMRFQGVEVKTMGDGFLVTFDGPARAAHCGLAIVSAARSLGIDVRVGIHTGEIERSGNDVAGMAVNIAARIGSLAAPGEVLSSRTVKDLTAGSDLTFSDRGERTLKGVPDTWQVFAVSER